MLKTNGFEGARLQPRRRCQNINVALATEGISPGRRWLFSILFSLASQTAAKRLPLCPERSRRAGA